MALTLMRKCLAIIALCLIPVAAPATDVGTVNFQFDSDQLDAEGRAQVAEIAARLLEIDSYKPTVVVGYTDAVGSSGYNLDLGQRRARTVANALAAAGVPVDRIGQVSSRGKNDLLVRVATAERANRRVTVTLEDILAACRSYRSVALTQSSIGDELQQDLLSYLTEAKTNYTALSSSGANGPAYQMAGAAQHDCTQAVGLKKNSLRKLEYAQKCFCNTARMRVAMGGL